MSQSRLSIIPSRAISDTNLTATQLRVLCAIGSYTSKDQTAYPRQATIAELLGISRKTVNQACQKLKDEGYLEIRHQYREDGSQRSNLYYVRLDPSVSVDVQIGTGGCNPSVTGGVTPSVTGGVTSRRYTNNDSILNDIREQARENIFDEMKRAGAPTSDVNALLRSAVAFRDNAFLVETRYERDRHNQSLEQFLKAVQVKVELINERP